MKPLSFNLYSGLSGFGLGIVLGFVTSLPSAAQGASGCGFTQVVGLNFGNYDVMAPTPTDAVGSFSFTCRGGGGGGGSFNNIPVTISLSRGNSDSYTPRRMIFESSTLEYNLYLDAARSRVWGDGTSGTNQNGPFVPGNNVGNTIEIFGRIPPDQWVTPGQYSDQIVITIQF
ncbi:spore coat U domain-containing protein [Candidatus Synechococcus calcipolaris G9]|uniref:Spore coat U domain-containing protein n=1 Tax=Candidatus Synechococcus calcipolaris G9 TaxID=1497997 RepID=A0ABT6EYY0_9SYNE|nr:spore coat U domain-containing protein [Candidatus Synechococcus calcipolaris]MDG2990636.1 spore coat U domain-containing protein [Candidatus Synechococcus calcipolaris G9]